MKTIAQISARMSEQIEKIRKITKEGYEIRIPGGKSRNEKSDYSCFNSIYAFGPEGIEVLVVPYKPYNFEKGDIPSQKDEPAFLEVPEGTLIRETLEETGIKIQKYDLLGCKKICRNKSPLHLKYAYATNVKDCDMSNIRIEPEENSRSLAPFPVFIQLLHEYLYKEHMWQLEMLENFFIYKEKKYYPRIIIEDVAKRK